MKTPLRVLFVEDSEDDTFLIVEDLKRAGFDPVFERVDTAADLAAALNRKSWDVVISDYSMPSFSGAAAFELFQLSGQDIPFISVSGSALGEKSAVAMMKAGVHDYIMKDDRSRLAPVIERELKAAMVRREQKREQAAAAHFAAVVESSEDAIISKTLDGTVVSWNKAAEFIYGYTALEMIGRPISVLAPPSRVDELTDILLQIRRGERVPRFETVRVRKDGRHVDLSMTVSPIKDSSGEVIGVSTIARDISERRREESERLKLIEDLTEALAHAKTLRGLLPICASCKRIRDDHGYWEQVEVYIQKHSDAGFTHGICPECAGRFYPEFATGNATSPPADGTKAA
jgi:two-component system, cell cycle sensor histidine kinase and response regulator CckA